MAEKKPKTVILMPVSDVAEWDDDKYLEGLPKVSWPRSGRSEEEVLAAAKKLPDPKAE